MNGLKEIYNSNKSNIEDRLQYFCLWVKCHIEAMISLLRFFVSKILFICLTERDHKLAERQAEREEEAGSPLSREPDAGLDPRTLRS